MMLTARARQVQRYRGIRAARIQFTSLIVSAQPSAEWTGLAAAVALWALGVGGHALSDPTLRDAPFLELSLSFWAGLALVHLVLLFSHRAAARYAAAIVIAGYFWLTIPVLFPLGYMHDSARNVAATAAALYPNGAFPGFTLFTRTLLDVTGMSPQALDRCFPAMAFVVYISLFAGLCCRLGRLARLDPDIGPLCLYGVAILGSAFNLRLNAAPQTLGYMVFLFIIVLLLRTGDPRSVMLSILALIAMVVSHPISPLLAIAGFYGVSYLTRRLKRASIVPGFVVLTLVLYTTWIIYRADWVVRDAIRILQSAVHGEKPVPLAGFRAPPDLATYLMADHVLLAATLVALLVAFLLLLRTQRRITIACLLWVALLVPVFALLYGSHDFLDRVSLFALAPAALIFAVAYTPLLAPGRSASLARLPLATGIMALGLLSAATSYFYAANVDRITAREIVAQRFVARTATEPVDIGGFQLPMRFRGPVLTDDRGTADGPYFRQARLVVVLQQARNAAVMRQGGFYRQTQLGRVERRLDVTWNRVYDDGRNRVYAR